MAFNIQKDIALKNYNTMALNCYAAHFCTVTTVDELLEAMTHARSLSVSPLLLGSGSNVVLTSPSYKFVILIRLTGIEINGRLVKAMAGENWDGLVDLTLRNQLYGIENLSAIPGTVGAAPIQNIGAYGVELSHYFESLTALDIGSGKICHFSKQDCHFSYRESIFKSSFKQAHEHQYIIISVTLLLDTQFIARLDYADLEKRFSDETPNAREVREAVCDIRRNKLPDPKIYGNCGSFFKNPIISEHTLLKCSQLIANFKGNAAANGMYKVSAAQLITALDLKGSSVGGACVSNQHALVIENRHNASAEDIKALAADVRQKVLDSFGIGLEVEPLHIA